MTQTTWGFRFGCPECGYESVTQDEELRDALMEWHEDREHDGRAVCTSSYEEDIPVDEFPADEDPEATAEAVSVTGRSLEVFGDV